MERESPYLVKTKRVIRSIVWDMGGVILRTKNPTIREQLAEQHDMTRHELEKLVFDSETARLAETGQISGVQHWKQIGDHLNLDPNQLLDFKQAFWEGDEVDGELVDYIRSQRPQYHSGLLSNAWLETRSHVKKYLNFLDAFDVSIFSAEVGLAKPDPKIYYLILELLGVKAHETIFIDDMKFNVSGAQAVGMHAIQFIKREQVLQDLHALL